MEALLSALNLSITDKALLIFSPICAMLGSLVHAIISEIDLSKFPKPGKNGKINGSLRTPLEFLLVLKWLFSRLVVGAIIGFVFSLYFIGIIKEDTTSLSRVFGFAVLVGYSAPKLWNSQEKFVIGYIDTKMKDIESLINKKIENVESNED
ncbi:MAG: hypothetical protein KA138_00110 [Saprospiraceae bacterium]|nr:hypothetical protein [Saprospiraceae bacterium]